MRANFVWTGVWTGIRRNLTMTVALVLSTAIALGFVGAAYLANAESNKFSDAYNSRLSVSVFLCTNIAHTTQVSSNTEAKAAGAPQRVVTCADGQATTQAQTDAIRTQLNGLPYVQSTQYFTQAQALASVKELQPDQAKFYRLGDIPAFFTVKLDNVDKDYPKLQTALASTMGVDNVTTPIKTIRKLLDLISSVRWFSVIVAIVVLVASILLIANTIQVAAQQRRNETSIMRLVGASRWMTELPFMLETIIAAILGGLISTGLVWLGKHFVMDNVLAGPTDTGTIPNLQINDVLVAGGLGLVVGIVLSAVTAFATLRLYVKV